MKISLAEWSLHRAIYGGGLDHLDFAAKAKRDFGISAVEYVNGFFGGGKIKFTEAGKNAAYLNELLKRSADAGVVNHLLMVDDEGPLAAADEKARLSAVENHKKWVEAAKILGCKSVRVNLQGEGSADEKKAASVDSLGRLGEFAGTMKINIVVENHGGVTSNGAWLAGVVKQVARPNVGTCPILGTSASLSLGDHPGRLRGYVRPLQRRRSCCPTPRASAPKRMTSTPTGNSRSWTTRD